MRQVYGLLKVISRANSISYYERLSCYGIIHGAKLPSLDEFLRLSLDKDESTQSNFDKTTDEFLEMRALKRFHERQKVNG